MAYTKYIFKKIELPKFLGKVIYGLKTNPALYVSLFLGLMVIYGVYVLITIQNWAGFEFNYQNLIINMTIVSGILAFLIHFLLRNKFEDDNYIFLHFSTSIKAKEIIHSGILIYLIFHLCLLFLSIFPFIIIQTIQLGYPNVVFICNILVSFSTAFYLVFNLWVISSLIINKIVQKGLKVNLIIKTFIYFILFIGIGYPYIKLLEGLEHQSLTFLMVLGFVFIINYLIVNYVSLPYIKISLVQLTSETTKNKTPKLKKSDSETIFHLKTELLSLTRSGVFKEQFIIFSFLFLSCIALYFYLDKLTFTFYSSYFINFGLKEIIIFISLEIGTLFNQNKEAIYSLNLKRTRYLYSRATALLVGNIVCFMLFIGSLSLLLNLETSINLRTIITIIFISFISLFIGYAIKISSSNRIIVVFSLLIGVNIYDFIVAQFINTPLLLNFLNISVAILFLIAIEIFLKRPILR